MPVQRRCKHSGAVIFELTKEEKIMKNTLEDIEKLKRENGELHKRLERLENKQG